MPIYKQTTEITNIDDILSSVERDIEEVYFGDKNIFTVWGEYEGTLPATFNANGDDMRQYQIYGNTGGVGDVTINIFDIKTATMGEYWINDNADTFTYNPGSKCYFIPVSNNVSYTITDFTEFVAAGTFVFRVAFTNEVPTQQAPNIGKTYRRQRVDSSGSTKHSASLTNNGYNYLAVQIRKLGMNNVTISEGITPVGTFVPYGYEVDMSTSDGTNSTTTPIYIGDTALQKDEYVDYAEQKVYRMIDGTLTPTDPPVALPALPTCDGTTITDYVGQSAAPEKAILKYRKKNF